MPTSPTIADILLDLTVGSGHDAGIADPVFVALLVLGIEPVGINNYSRISVANDDSEWTDGPGAGQKSNVNTQTFPTLTGGIGTVDSVAIYDADPGGNLIASGALDNLMVTGLGSQLQFLPGTLRLGFQP